MATSTTTISFDFDDHLRPIPTIEAPESLLAVDELDGPSLASTLKLPDSSSQFLSPIPAPTAQTKPPPTFSLSDLYDGTQEGLETLGPEIASADITVAVDGSFLETSSGPAARELKRRFDQLAGVGPSVRSPYAITAFVNQHGKSMYRVGHRDEHSAPAKNAAEVEDQINQSKAASTASQSPRTKRRSRLSMHFLPPTMFSKSSTVHPPPAPPSRPPTAGSSNTPTSRKLQRRTRSIPDLYSAANANGSTSGPTFTATGRAHSQSVTAADLPRPSLTFNPPPLERKFDAFAQLMDWFTPSSSVSSNFSMFDSRRSSLDPVRPRATVAQPFGNAVSFKSPSQKPPVERNQPPRHLRVMQSFESGLTARQDDMPANDSPMSFEPTEEDGESNRPPSAIRLAEIRIESDEKTDGPVPEPDATISPESLSLSSHYTEVFNVLQTYRGLPLFETLADEDTTVIKLSLAADSSAAPRDDPRFVIWGEVYPEQDADDYRSSSRDSLTDVSNPSSSFSKRRNSKVPKMKSPEASTSRLPPVEDGQRVLLAATIERWIAQLTSDLNYDELLNFFLTFRTYVSAVDLCHLLICRFHWALQKPSSLQDEKVRRIVRVRTFVAIRYWLLTFFTVDFIPNRELRQLVADWLNTLLHDPVLKKHVDGMDIVRRLVKVAKECKRAHTRADAHAMEKPKSTSPPRSAPETPPANHLLGKSFAEAIRKPALEDTESDLDLDFLPDDAKSEEPSTGFPSDPANAHLTVGLSAGGVALSSSSRPSSLPLSSFNILQRTDHAPGPNTETDLPFVQNPVQVPLPNNHSALSRAFVRTIGRLGRWKRVLAPKSSVNRPTVPLGPCAGVSAFDLEISASRDLLTMNGAVEQYLRMVDPPPMSSTAKLPTPTNASVAQVAIQTPLPSSPPEQLPDPPLLRKSSFGTSLDGGSHSPQSPQSPASPITAHSKLSVEAILPPIVADETPRSLPTHPVPVGTPGQVEASDETACASDDSVDGSTAVSDHAVDLESFNDEVDRLRQPERAESFRSSSTDSFGQPLTADGPLLPSFPGTHSQWQFDTVSIDELDFSDTSSLLGADDPQYPPGLRKPVRKLPMRRDFEFVRRSEVSSMGIVSHESMRDSFNSSNHSASPTSSTGGPQPIQKWQMKSLQQTFESMSNNSDDKGDVEAALLRLEGQINPKVIQEKAEKVDGWVRNLRERMANGDYDYASSIFSEDEPEFEGFIDEVDQPVEPDLERQLDVVLSTADDEQYYEHDETDDTVNTPMPTQTTHQLPDLTDLDSSKDTKPAVEDVVPLEILQSRMPSVDAPLVDPSIDTVLPSKFANPEAPRIHRSFILNYAAEVLAQHFSMIDRELFMSVKFEELVTEDWTECEEIDVSDWAQYLKDRARWKVESRFPDKTTALAAVRARFNLMVSFVISEIVLTPPSERPLVVGKFIRIAWKCYSLSNFNTLTAIISALQTHWVSKAMRKPGWSRIGTFESRMYRDLKQFTTHTNDFKFMRQVVDSIVDAKPLETSTHTASVVSGGTDPQSSRARAGSEIRPAMPSACIPFIGIYLSQLHRLNKLPALIDPTAPHSIIGIDPETAIFDTPAHPEVFSTLAPLPPSMHLEPLINVHKQRRIADVIKSLVAGQHLASRVHFDVDKKLFQRCLRLRGLDPTYLQRALAMYPD